MDAKIAAHFSPHVAKAGGHISRMTYFTYLALMS